MKAIILIFILAAIGCDQNSSPEGRMTLKIESIQKELDSLKMQNALILDSIGKMNEELKRINR
jgi:predicted HTH domain antitoxin